MSCWVLLHQPFEGEVERFVRWGSKTGGVEMCEKFDLGG